MTLTADIDDEVDDDTDFGDSGYDERINDHDCVYELVSGEIGEILKNPTVEKKKKQKTERNENERYGDNGITSVVR